MTVTRGFPDGEFRNRLARAQRLMEQAGLAALLLTTEPEIRYFTGFLTRFWESPTRPWFLVVPASGDPIAVIPSIGVHLMGQSWIRDIRTWVSPDYDDDGISLVCDALGEVVPNQGQIGLPDGTETHARLPLASLEQIRSRLGARQLVGDHNILRQLRLIKSDAEIAKISQACDIAGRAFDRVGEIAHIGVPLAEVFRRFQMLCLSEGADWMAYLAGGAGPDGYEDVISPADDRPLERGDVLMLDTGVVFDGYYCDFDRNFALGAASDAARATFARLIEATQAAFDVARPGLAASDLFHTWMTFCTRVRPQADLATGWGCS